MATSDQVAPPSWEWTKQMSAGRVVGPDVLLRKS